MKKEITHKGIDVAAPTGTQVFATGDDVVRKAEEDKGRGKFVIVEHEDDYATVYAHLDEEGLKVE